MPETSSSRLPEEAKTARDVRAVIDALNGAGVRYCHWKSNSRLAAALRAESDLDLLIARADATRFQEIVGSLGYKPCTSDAGPAICHYYGLDRETGRLVHLHAYYRIVTGGAVLKNHRLPLEALLLGAARPMDGVLVPERSAELVSFVIRKTLEYAGLIEALFLAREGSAVVEELRWLSEGASEAEISRLLREHLPEIDLELWQKCREAIDSGSALARFRCGRRLASRLRKYARYGRARAALFRTSRLMAKLGRQVVRRRSRHVLLSGGAVVAVVGSDGAGKSTVVAELTAWLKTSLRVRSIHAGKPPATLTTALLHALVPLLRRCAPRYRMTAVERRGDEASKPGPETLRSDRLFFLYALRAVAVAHERKRLLVRAHRQAGNGTVIVSDRYTTLQPSVPEGPALSFLLNDRNLFYAWLGRIEASLYRAIPRPDFVLHLQLPVDLACHRNLTRDKAGERKPASVIRRRHAQSAEVDFPGVAVHRVNTDADLGTTMLAVKEIVWTEL